MLINEYTYVYIYIYIGRALPRAEMVGKPKRGGQIPVSVKKTFVLCQPLPCNPAAETPLQPLIWVFSD